MRVKQLIFTSVLILITIVIVNGQTKNNYTAQWKKVDSLVNQKGLTRSALTEVQKIYALAKKEKNDAQVIKALSYTLQLQQGVQEDSVQSNVEALEKEIAASTEPARSILKSILADAYRIYFQNNRYRLFNRTTVKNFEQKDIETWDAEALIKKINQLFLESVANETLLQQTKLEPFDAIIMKGNVRYLRPTLYDLLAHKALDYFKTNDYYFPKPVNAFQLTQAVAFAEPERFVEFKFETQDTLSIHFKAIQLYQRLIKFHLKDAKPGALIDVDIARLQFANLYSTLEKADKEYLYRNALSRIIKKYPDEPTATLAAYLLADSYYQKGAEYNPPGDTAGHFDYLKAKEIIEKIAARKDSVEGVIKGRNLLQLILRKEVSLEAETVNVPSQPFRMLVNYRNTTQIYVRIVKMDQATKDKLGESWQPVFWNNAVKLPAIKSYAQELPAAGNDHQKHSVEIKVDGLPVGEYALIAALDKDFSVGDNPMAMQLFYVSNIAYINNLREYFVLNRQTGAPITDAKVQLWYNTYDNNIRKWKTSKRPQFEVDKNGRFRLNIQQTARGRENMDLEITTATDRLYMNGQMVSYEYSGADAAKQTQKEFEKQNQKTFFFTDRSLYRPAQVVYFKGIIVTRDFNTRNSKIVSGFATTVYLKDVNGRAVDSMRVTSNEFGSYSGRFTLPANVLTGSFTIDDNTGGFTQFSVEEYKRPKFFVEYKKPEGTYRVNDTITITGFAKAYAGNNIDGATVKYRVRRVPRFIYPWAMYKIRNPRTTAQEIANGTVTTAADGTFTIRFAAVPDVTIARETEPVFDYEVTADITDINGETRSGSTTVSVSYKALQLNITVPGTNAFNEDDILPADSLKTVSISTTNMAGEFQKSLITVAVYKLNAPQRLIRERLWEEPDQFVMSKEEYIRNFPNDEYSNETKKETWERLNKVFERKDSSKAEQIFVLRNNPLERSAAFEPGWYAIEVTATDKYGQQVKDIKFVQLLETKTGKPVTPSYVWQYPAFQSKQPGQTASINVGTSADNVFLIQNVDKYISYPDDGVTQVKAEEKNTYNFNSLNNENRQFNFPVTEADRGGFRVSHAFVKHNRFYKVYSTIDVPWSNKELNITYETYRDKILPGSQEKWKVKISGSNNEKVAAEVLTAMYDASLDQFKPHSWNKPSVWPTQQAISAWSSTNFTTTNAIIKQQTDDNSGWFENEYDQLISVSYVQVLGYGMNSSIRRDSRKEDDAIHMKLPKPVAQLEATAGLSNQSLEEVVVNDGSTKPGDNTANNANIQIRKNFNETAFFFPDLKTDSAGNVEFSFTMPEALTQWKWMMFSHSKELAMNYSTKSIVTQKELMVQPNIPRFVREGDRMDFSAKLVNMSDKEMSGQIELQLRDATTNQSVDGWFQNMFPNQYFTAAAGQSTVINFTVQIPYQFNKPLIVRFIARAGNLSDGEENAIPVLSNRLLVTETLPLNVRGGGSKNFTFEKLLNSANSETLSHHALTVEFTSNPAWYAVQALPYLMEYPYECAEQVWNRVYANALASKIVNSAPRIKQIFEKWKTTDTAALISNLQKNEELKSILLEETPWVLEAKNETEQRKRIAMLFDMVKLGAEFDKNIAKLADMQSGEGAFPWFKGGPNDRYITQYIVAGIGHLKKLNAITPAQMQLLDPIVKSALSYLDQAMKTDYDRLVQHKADLTRQQLSYIQIHYLYARSFFNNIDAAGNTAQPFNYFRKQSQQFWLQQGRYAQSMIALSLFRTGDGKTSVDILRSLKQNAIVNPELGMYWKDITAGYYWHQAPIETQSLMIEAFTEITKDITAADALKTWLLKNKQTNSWNTTKATADACYALLLQGTDWLSSEPVVQIKLGDKNVSSLDQKTEAGSGYFKKVFDAPFVNSGMGNITVNVTQPNGTAGKPVSNTSWGAVYWQYFENLENITPAATPLKLSKKLFVERNTDRGPVLEPIQDNGSVKVGDKIKVRIELRVDRDMEYVHMKDMRASSLEPVNVLSSWKWQGGLGYYEATKDASTNFFFNYLPKGTYVFEYPLFVTHTGSFSNGITSIQCMYAPEFSSHSEGVKINVE